MNESRFGSLDTFVEVGNWSYRMGRPVANEGFLKALLSYGGLDTYEFFCPDIHHMDAFTRRVEELAPDAVSRVKPSLQAALSESIAATEYLAFHLGDFTYAMPRLVALRNRLATRPFPVTGVTHSLDAVRMGLRFVELALSGLASWDGIVCTSLAAREAVRKGLQWAEGCVTTGGSTEASPRMPTLERIPLGIDEAFFQEADRAQARNHFRIPEDTVVGLSVGRFSLRQKADWSPVLEQLARMEAAGSLERFLLIIAGGAEDTEVNLLETLLSSMRLERRVLLFPNVPPDLKPTLYRAADIYLSLVDNYQETFGLSIVEALASGLPVICSDFSGYRELVTPGETGWLIPTTAPEAMPEFLSDSIGVLDPSVARLFRAQTVALDLQALEQVLVTALKNEPLRMDMGRKARQAASAFHWRAVIEQYEALWHRLWKEADRVGIQSCRSRSEPLLGNLDRVFSHYPKQRLTGVHALSLTPVGREALFGKALFVRYEDVSVVLFSELEHLILERLDQRAHTVAELEKIAAEYLEATPGQTLFHILWLMKHGALSAFSSGESQ